MKLFGLNINKVTAAEVSTKKINKRQSLEIGDTGVEQSYGHIFEEYRSDLQAEKGVKAYNDMYKSDGTVRAVVRVCTLPVQSAEWFVTPASEEKIDVEIADFVERALFEYLKEGWDYTLRHALMSLPYGVMVFEKVFGNAVVDGQERIIWNTLAPRLPKSIQKWAIGTGGNEFGITQVRGDGATVDIPGDKLLIVVNEREGDNWWGDSVLRPAYKHWFYKNTFYKIDAIAFERQGVGVPYAELPEHYSNDDKNQANKILKNMRANEQAHVMYDQNWEVGFMDMKASGTRDPEKSIAHHNREITKSVLAQFLELGASGGSGSRAVSSDQSELFLQALVATAKNIAGSFNGAIKELVILNYGEQQWYPKLNFSGIIKTDGEKIAKVYSMLSTSGAIIPGDVDERFFREVLKLPFREDDDVREVEKSPADVKEDSKEDVTSSEHNHSKKKVFSAGDKPEGKRALTFAEEKVDFIALEKEFDKIEERLDKNGKELLQDARAKYIDKLDKAMKGGDVEEIRKATMGAQKEYEKALAGAMTDAFETGKQSASTEMKVKTPATPAEMTKNIKIQANAIAEAQVAEISARSKTAYIEAINKESDHVAALAAANLVAKETIDKLVRNTKNIIVAAHIGYGRDDVMTKNADKVYALQRSEILDNKTCNYCLSVDGRVVEKNDSFAKVTAYHSGCRGIWVAILADEEDLPTIGGIPASLRDRFGGDLNDLDQPKKPLVKKTSPAQKELDKRDEDF